MQTGAELEGSVRILNDEKTRLAQQLDDLRAERDSLSRDRSDIDQQRQALVLEKEKLEKYALQLRQCSKDMEERCLVGYNNVHSFCINNLKGFIAIYLQFPPKWIDSSSCIFGFKRVDPGWLILKMPSSENME